VDAHGPSFQRPFSASLNCAILPLLLDDILALATHLSPNIRGVCLSRILTM
jgi:hypothetical protein